MSESSYLTAIYTYTGAASLFLLYLTWVLSRYWRAPWVALVVLVCAALLLTPAYPDAQVSTMAPALVVALFEGLVNGPEAARHAIKPLLLMTALALGLSGVLALTVFRKRPAA